jgi:hypothetical protein
MILLISASQVAWITGKMCHPWPKFEECHSEKPAYAWHCVGLGGDEGHLGNVLPFIVC